MKPYSEACEQNKRPILAILKEAFAATSQVLEIGSGSGQHAIFLAAELPHLSWQTSDREENHPGVRAWLEEAQLDNVLPPLSLDVGHSPWPDQNYDGVFSANTTHIMHWPEVEKMFVGIGQTLSPGGRFCLYGPFNINGQYSAASNARFEVWLQQRDPDSGIRDMADLDKLASRAGLMRVAQHAMPADNFILVWEKTA